MRASRGKAVVKVIAYTLVILVVVAIFGVIYKFTNGFNEDFKTFYVEYNGKPILTTDSKTTLNKGESHRFDVKYTFDNGKSEPKDYKVKVVPNVERDFDFTVDGERYLYSKEKDLTAGFGLKKRDTYFELTIKKDIDIQTVLSSVYEGKTVVVPQEAEIGNPYPFKLVISSYNESITYHIRFNFLVRVTGVELSETDITFTTAEETIPPSEPDTSEPDTSAPDIPVNPDEGEYFIEYDTLGNGSNLHIDFQCQARANAGDRVEFTLGLVDLSDRFDDYEPVEITNVRLEDCNTGEEVDGLNYENGTYWFIMPNCDVTVMIYLMQI